MLRISEAIKLLEAKLSESGDVRLVQSSDLGFCDFDAAEARTLSTYDDILGMENSTVGETVVLLS